MDGQREAPAPLEIRRRTLTGLRQDPLHQVRQRWDGERSAESRYPGQKPEPHQASRGSVGHAHRLGIPQRFSVNPLLKTVAAPHHPRVYRGHEKRGDHPAREWVESWCEEVGLVAEVWFGGLIGTEGVWIGQECPCFWVASGTINNCHH